MQASFQYPSLLFQSSHGLALQDPEQLSVSNTRSESVIIGLLITKTSLLNTLILT